jgi:hypothetical protein
MPTSHRPEFDAFRKESGVLRAKGLVELKKTTKFKSRFMWPYINQEDLSQPKLMLLLVNARGRCTPPLFAAVDNDAMHLGKALMAVVPKFLNSHIMTETT